LTASQDTPTSSATTPAETLVTAESLRAELAAKSDGSLGAQLVISASKPRWPTS